jgi:hypothetical protein
MYFLFRTILILILVYFVYRGIRFLINLLIDPDKSENQFKKSGKGNKSSIDKKDIIDAEFEEINESEKSK